MAGIYIHIPFCRQACNYCNFYFSVSTGNKEKFVAALLKEIELTKNYLAGETIETLYFGGGTPSLLTIEDFRLIIDKLQSVYDLSTLQEFTVEANPDDLTSKKVNALKELQAFGLNRFSIGIQSFFDEDLKYMNRAHNSEEGLASVKRVQDAGFANITIDLIYGTPTMNDKHWRENLARAFALNVPHISSYALTVEPKTNLERKIRNKKALPVNEAQAAAQFRILMEEMREHGFEQYEISNFARPGKHAIHNSNYWFGKKYLGLGPSAHSYNTISRRWNVANNLNYIESINNNILRYEEELLTPAQKVNEQIMTGLRTKWGVSITNFQLPIFNAIEKNLKQIDASHYVLKDGVLTLTDEGKFFADAIAAALFVD
ncbi:MAG: radical SAM family heme chaperone HemW [Chitinophagales bacterium]|nr:radical SAM family heme chaperone HemW [Chitinophagales bacterium]